MLAAGWIRQYRLWCGFAAACLSFVASGYATAAGEIQLHASYCGEFKWHVSAEISQVRYDFLRRERLNDSTLEIAGVGWSQGHRSRTNFSFRAVVDTQNGNIFMTESVGPGVKDYVTDGSYRGKVEQDGNSIVAVWTNNRPPNEKGVLRLSRCN